MAAGRPGRPGTPTTVSQGNSVLISWTQPDNGGASITAFTVKIRKEDLSFTEAVAHCDGTSLTVIQDLQCSVPESVLKASPFNLVWGSSIYAKITAVNVKGTSTESLAGNGAIITTVPNAPENLANNTTLTNAT